MADKTPNKIWIELQTARKYYSGNAHVQVALVPVKCENEYEYPTKIEHFYGSSEPMACLDAYQYIWQDYATSTYFDVRYQNVGEIRTHNAKQMYQTLSAIERKIEKMRVDEGSPKTAGQWALRFCKALGAAGLVYSDSDGQRRMTTGGDVVDTVDQILREEKTWLDGQKDR